MNLTILIILGAILGISGMFPALIAAIIIGFIMVKVKKVNADEYVYSCSTILGINTFVIAIGIIKGFPVELLYECIGVEIMCVLYLIWRLKILAAILAIYYLYSIIICIKNYAAQDTSFTQVQFASNIILRLIIMWLLISDIRKNNNLIND